VQDNLKVHGQQVARVLLQENGCIYVCGWVGSIFQHQLGGCGWWGDGHKAQRGQRCGCTGVENQAPDNFNTFNSQGTILRDVMVKVNSCIGEYFVPFQIRVFRL
jgi:hypothetical protein